MDDDSASVGPADLVGAVATAGYSATLAAVAPAAATRRRLVVSALLSAPVLLISMVPALQFRRVGARRRSMGSGTPILLVQLLLGLRPDRRASTLVADVDELPEWMDGLRLDGVQAFGRWWSVQVHDGTPVVEEETEAARARD